MQLERLDHARAVAERAADLVADAVRAKEEAVLLLPAGATPVPLYAELVRRARAGALDLTHARLFQLDELVGVGPNDPRGFQAFLRQHLVRPLGLERRFQALDGTARDPAGEIERHRAALAAVGPADLVLLGLGGNGHVAFNEPGSAEKSAARVVELAPETREELRARFPADCPERGLTLGVSEIAAARRVVMLVTGSAKSAVLARARRGPPSAACPASWLARHPRFLVLADAAAAGSGARAGA